MTTFVYKIMKQDDWAAATQSKTYLGSHDDVRDGYIHLSAADQVSATLEKHFHLQDNLVLVQFNPDALAPHLKWETSRGGARFPHLYAPLPTDLAISVMPIGIDGNGRHHLPDMAGF